MIRFITLASVLALVACGGAGKKNVEACEDYVASLECGEFDFSTIYGEGFCDAYSETTCDISDYFNCLTEGSTCSEDGIYTPALDCTIATCE